VKIVFLFFSLGFSVLQAQNCNCTISQVQNNTVTPCNLTIGTVVTVNSVSAFKNAINQANTNGGNMTILIENGTYQIASATSYPYITGSNVVIRSLSGSRDAVILRGGGMVDVSPNTENGLGIAGDNVTIADLTIREVGNHGIQVSGHNLYVHNVRIQSTYQQMIKGATSASGIDSGIVQCSLFEYPAGAGPQYYIGGLDIHKGKNWIVRDNVFRNIASPSGSAAEHAVHFWDNCSDNTVERNCIINCDRGIGFGLGSSPNTGGIIRNNMIYNNGAGPFDDVGIGLETSPYTKVYNNSVYINYVNAIEYRFAGTHSADVKNNLANKLIVSRDGGAATLGTNITNAQPGWFVNTSAGDLHLASNNSLLVDMGTSLPAFVADDIDKTSRPQAAGFDVGAHEYTIPQSIVEPSVKYFSVFPNPSNGQFTIYGLKPGDHDLEIHDIVGKMIFHSTIDSSGCTEAPSERSITVRAKSGIYFVKAMGEKGDFTVCKIVLE